MAKRKTTTKTVQPKGDCPHCRSREPFKKSGKPSRKMDCQVRGVCVEWSDVFCSACGGRYVVRTERKQ